MSNKASTKTSFIQDSNEVDEHQENIPPDLTVVSSEKAEYLQHRMEKLQSGSHSFAVPPPHGDVSKQKSRFTPFHNRFASCFTMLQRPVSRTNALDEEFFPDITLMDVTCDSSMQLSGVNFPQTPLSSRKIRVQEQVVDVNLNNMSPTLTQNIEVTCPPLSGETLQFLETSQDFSEEPSFKKSRLTLEQTTAGEEREDASQNSVKELSTTLTGNLTQDIASFTESVVQNGVDLSMGNDHEDGRISLGSNKRQTANTTSLVSGHPANVTHDLNPCNDSSPLCNASHNGSLKNVTLDLHSEQLETSYPNEHSTKEEDSQMGEVPRGLQTPHVKSHCPVNTTFTSIQPAEQNASVNLSATTEIQPPHNMTVDLTPETSENITNQKTINLTHSIHETPLDDLNPQNRTMDLHEPSVEHEDAFVNKPMTVSTATAQHHQRNTTLDLTKDVADGTFQSNSNSANTSLINSEPACLKNQTMDLTTNCGAQTTEIEAKSLNICTSILSKTEQMSPQSVAGQTFDSDVLNPFSDADASSSVSSKSEKLCTHDMPLDVSPPTVCNLPNESEDAATTAPLNLTPNIPAEAELSSLRKKTQDPLILNVSSVTFECEDPAEAVVNNTSIQSRGDSSACLQNRTLDVLPTNVNTSNMNNEAGVDSTKANGLCEAQAAIESQAQFASQACPENESPSKITSPVATDSRNNGFDSKTSVETTLQEANPCNKHQLSNDRNSPQTSVDLSSSPKSKDGNTCKCATQTESSVSAVQTEAFPPAQSKTNDTLIKNVASEDDQSQKNPSNQSLSDSLGLQTSETFKANAFNLDDSLDMKSGYMFTSTPMVDCKTFNFTNMKEEKRSLASQKKLYGECPSRPAGPTTSETASNIVSDRKTFLAKPTAKSSWSLPKSRLTKLQPGSVLPRRTDSLMSHLPMTRQRTLVKVLSAPMMSEASQEVAGKSGFYNLRSTVTGFKLPNSGLQKPQFSCIASGIQRVGLDLRPLSARNNATAQSTEKPTDSAGSVAPKTAVTKKHPFARGENLPTAKKIKTDFSNSLEASASASDVVNKVKMPRQLSTLQRPVPAKKDDAPVHDKSTASQDQTSRIKSLKPPTAPRMLPTKTSGHVCSNCVASEQKLKALTEEVQRLKAELSKYKKRE